MSLHSLFSSVCRRRCIPPLEPCADRKHSVIGRPTRAGEQLYHSYHLFLSFALSFIPDVQLPPFLKFSSLLSVCHRCHSSTAPRFSIPSFTLHTILSSSFHFTLLEKYCCVFLLWHVDKGQIQRSRLNWSIYEFNESRATEQCLWQQTSNHKLSSFYMNLLLCFFIFFSIKTNIRTLMRCL